MSTNTELISRYINNELSESENKRFEESLKINIDLKKEYELQLNIIEGVNRLGLKNQIVSSFKNVKYQKTMKKATIGLAIVIAIVGSFLLVKNTMNKPVNNLLYQLNEQGNNKWAEADKQTESQIFTINPERDTIIETKNGSVFSILAKSFLNKLGEVPKTTIDLEIKEAITPLDIMKAGLSTLSDGKLLETGGMFYVNARNREENLIIDKSKPLNVNIPVNNNKNDMMLFRGERKADGSINWVNPISMKKKLSTVEITSLNFYPEHFLDTLSVLGFDIKNKKLTDSIYYSYSGYVEAKEMVSEYYFSDEAISDSTAPVMIDKISYEKPNGKNLFMKNCAVCHSMSSQKLTGPGMAGILNRAPKGDWLNRYILNNNKLIRSGDAYANKLVAMNGGVDGMGEYEYLTADELKALVQYITGQDKFNFDEMLPDEGGYLEINPAKVKAIWNKKFNHTLLATKEFEERLKVIFTTCDGRILNLYVNNLTKNLYEIDSIAATLLSGDLKNKFLNFYNRKDGGVEISDKQSKKLQTYFEEKKTIYTNAVNKVLEKMYADENLKSQLAYNQQTKHFDVENLRTSKIFTEELEINMDEAYRQLGKERQKIVVEPLNTYLSAPIIFTGWYNVDKYVVDATVKRKSLNYSDPETGKKAIIKYAPLTITITNFKKYDRVVSYLIPNKLSSFQLIKNAGSVFKENLNELMNYSVLTIGFIGSDTYYNEIKNAKAQPYEIDLISINTKGLSKKLNADFPINLKSDLSKDINYQLFDIKEKVRQNKVMDREKMRERIKGEVFPCQIPSEADFE